MTQDSKEKSLSAPARSVPATALSSVNNPDDRLWILADKIKSSSIVPKDYINKPENIFVAMLYGREIGLHPMQSVQSIMVVNGRPSMWGDAVPGLVLSSNLMTKFEEEWDPSTNTATCRVRRKGDEKDHVQTFSLAEAQKAGLTNKDTWKNYPKRMCQMRARAFALRDKFADVLKGVAVREEVEDYQILEPVHEIVREPESITSPVIAENAQEIPAAAPVAAEPVDPERIRLDRATSTFKLTYGLPHGTVEKWLDAKKFPSLKAATAYLSDLWIKAKADTIHIDNEFGKFLPPKPDPDASDAQEPVEELFGK